MNALLAVKLVDLAIVLVTAYRQYQKNKSAGEQEQCAHKDQPVV